MYSTSLRNFVRRHRRAICTACGLLLACITIAQDASAGLVQIPLHVNYLILTEGLREQLYKPSGQAQLWRGDNSCEYLNATNPTIGQRDGGMGIETDGDLSLGMAVGDQCLSPITWSGIMDAASAPHVAGFFLKFRITDINLYDSNHQKTRLLERGFDLIKSSIVPALETFSFDLSPAIHQLQELGQLAASNDAAGVRLALTTIRLEPSVTAEKEGLRLTLDVDLPASASATPLAAPAAPLNAEEIAAWNTALDNWDAFLAFAVKQVGATVPAPEVRAALFDVLIDSRQRLLKALAQPQRLSGPDPVRLLFIDEWTRLGAVVEKAAAQGRLGNHSLEFLSFISAGDALFALDQAAPALGITISADDLRRLARIMAPAATGDPLTYGFQEDPELQEIFGVGTPLEQPGSFEVPEEPTTAASAGRPNQSSGDSNSRPAAAESPAPAGASGPEPPGEGTAPVKPSPPGPVSMLSSVIRLFAPRAALANDTRRDKEDSAMLSQMPRPAASGSANTGQADPHVQQVAATQLVSLGLKLRGVVVSNDNALVYRDEVNQLLVLAAQYQSADDPIEGESQRAWPLLLKAAAWQESCWRQFTVKHRRVWYLESRSGDIGLMQVNKYVWRGFYSLPRLRWDIVYNAGAGSQILMRFFADAGRRPHSDNTELVRAAYSAYNGGPSAYDRWRQPHEPKALRQIDQAFWLKYQAIAGGKDFDIVSCASDWDRMHAQ
jgi:Transglycosylase SLT domain